MSFISTIGVSQCCTFSTTNITTVIPTDQLSKFVTLRAAIVTAIGKSLLDSNISALNSAYSTHIATKWSAIIAAQSSAFISANATAFLIAILVSLISSNGAAEWSSDKLAFFSTKF